MDKKILGLIFVIAGSSFLTLSLTASLPKILWAVLLGTSIILNITGTAILIQFIKTEKRSSN